MVIDCSLAWVYLSGWHEQAGWVWLFPEWFCEPWAWGLTKWRSSQPALETFDGLWKQNAWSFCVEGMQSKPSWLCRHTADASTAATETEDASRYYWTTWKREVQRFHLSGDLRPPGFRRVFLISSWLMPERLGDGREVEHRGGRRCAGSEKGLRFLPPETRNQVGLIFDEWCHTSSVIIPVTLLRTFQEENK